MRVEIFKGQRSGPKKYWVSCVKFTVQVTVNEEGRIVEAAPIVRKFIGQPFANLKKWASSFGGVRVRDLGEKDEEDG